MAIFKIPRISENQRSQLILEESELVFDTTRKSVYAGDGHSYGGKPVGSVNTFYVVAVLSQQNILQKRISLIDAPLFPDNIKLVPDGGPMQVNGIDFRVVGTELIWDNLGLDGFLEENDRIIIYY